MRFELLEPVIRKCTATSRYGIAGTGGRALRGSGGNPLRSNLPVQSNRIFVREDIAGSIIMPVG
jgi:hypothetical protein